MNGMYVTKEVPAMMRQQNHRIRTSVSKEEVVGAD